MKWFNNPTTQFELVAKLGGIAFVCIFVNCVFTSAVPVNSQKFNEIVSQKTQIHGDAPNSSICRNALKKATSQGAKCNVSLYFRGCQFDSGFFSYLKFQYCYFNSPALPTVLMVFWLFGLLGAFAVIADSFFSPSLIALACSMRMSQNLAGVTLLAFGNGAPDVFSAITAITTGDPEAPDEGLGLGFLMGSGLLVNTVTAGLVMVIKPFVAARRPYIKDTIFYMGAVTWSAVILIRRVIYLSDAIGFICLYLVYVLTTWITGYLNKHKKTSRVYLVGRKFLKRIFEFMRHRCSVCLPNSENENQSKNKSISTSIRVSCFRRFLLRFQTATSQVKCFSVESGNNSSISFQTDIPRTSDAIQMTGFQKLDDHGISKIEHPELPLIKITSAPLPDDGSSPPALRIPKHQNNASLQLPTSQIRTRIESTVPTLHSNRTISSNYSRRGSQTIGSSFGRSHVGGIGFRSRTPSMNQRKTSQKMSTADQLPFVVRWIIANQETEEKSLIEAAALCADSSMEKKTLPPKIRRFSASVQTPSTYYPSGIDSQNFFHRKSIVPIDEKGYKIKRSTSVSLPVLNELPLSDEACITFAQQDLNHQDSLSKSNQDVYMGSPRIDAMVQFDVSVSINEQPEEEMVREPDTFVQWASKNKWTHLAYSICPLDISEWNNLSFFVKLLQIIQSPIFLIFRLTIPVVYKELDHPPIILPCSEIELPSNQISEGEFHEQHCSECLTTTTFQDISFNEDNNLGSREIIEEPIEATTASMQEQPPYRISDFEHLHGWCQLLNCFQCLVTPIIWFMLITIGGRSFGLHMVGSSRWPVAVIVMIISFAVSLLVYFTSKWDQAPKLYHQPFFATMGFLTSVIWIYAIAHELVNSLEALGIVWEISEAILGISVMAFASSISDLMSNSLLAYNGYPRIAFAACIGSPLFNLLIGAGISYTIKIGRSGDYNAELSFTLTHALLFTFLLIVLALNLLIAFFYNFHMGKVYGIILLIIYAIFITLAILVEADVIFSPKTWRLLTGTE